MDDTLDDLAEIYMHGRFINETETHWIFQEEEVEEPENWQIEKKQLKGKPPLDHYGYLVRNNSHFPIETDGKFYVGGGLGKLLYFIPCPF